MMRASNAAFCALLLMVPAIASAGAVVFSNLGTSPVYDTSGGDFAGNGLDSSGNTYAEADTFTPTFNSKFSSLDIALSCATFSSPPSKSPGAALGCFDTFTVALTSSSSDTPASVLESFTVAGTSLGANGSNNPLVVLNSALTPTLTAGTQYWITVTADLNDSIVWNWNNTVDSSDQGQSLDGGSTWFVSNPITGIGQTPGAYEVFGTVSGAPEPTTAASLFLGALLLVVFRGRRGVSTLRK